jgi:hypothetical protein
MKDLTTFPVQEQAISELTTSALAGDHIDSAALVEALTIVLETKGLPTAVSEGGAIILNLKAQIEMLIQAEARIAGRRAYLEGLCAAAKDWALKLMQDAGVKRISGDGAIEIVRRSNPPKLEIVDENAIPILYRKMELVENFDKRGMATALKEGAIIPGARLVQTERLEVK